MKINESFLSTKQRAACVDSTKKLKEKIALYEGKHREVTAAYKLIEETKPKIEQLQKGCKLGDLEKAREILILKESAETARQRIIHHQWDLDHEWEFFERLYNESYEPFVQLASAMRRTTVNDLTKKITPIVGDDDAARMAELALPVVLLTELISAEFKNYNLHHVHLEACKLMVGLSDAALDNDFDPMAWRRGDKKLLHFIPAKPLPKEEIQEPVETLPGDQ